MRIFSTTLVVLVLASLVGCGSKGKATFTASNSQAPGLPDFQEAGQTTYKYAFSGQVLNASSQTPVKNFAVSVLNDDPAIGLVLNALGDANGIFHISRTPSSKEALSSTLPLLISAPGFETALQALEVGADCLGNNCIGSKALPFVLKPTTNSGPLASLPSVDSLSASGISQLVDKQGVPSLFKQLLSTGKLDPAAAEVFAKAKNQDFVPNMLVLLKGAPEAQIPEIVSALLGSVSDAKLKGLGGTAGMTSSLVQLLAASNPGVGNSLLAVNTLLPYLTPIVGAVGDKSSGTLGQVLAALLAGKNADQNLINLASLLQNGNNPKFAMASFLPLVQGLLSKQSGANPSPFVGFLTGALKDPSFLNLFSLGKAGSKDANLALLVSYLQPLLQGLVGRDAPELATLLNELLKKDGVLGLKDFKSLPAQEKFAKLIPYIEPLIAGLNSKDSSALASFLIPLADQANPALALRELLTKGGGSTEKKAQLASALFPGLSVLLNQTVPGKQLFTTQLVQGLVGGDFKDLRVMKDLQGVPAVILSGQARDLFRIANLPNVEKMLPLR